LFSQSGELKLYYLPKDAIFIQDRVYLIYLEKNQLIDKTQILFPVWESWKSIPPYRFSWNWAQKCLGTLV